MDDINAIINLIREFGLWLVFAWLFVKEREAHSLTRTAHFEDLRDMAGLKTRLQPTKEPPSFEM